MILLLHSFQIRARSRGDLEKLKKHAGLSEDVIETLHADYHYRLVVSRKELACCMEMLAEEVDYPNFKSEVARLQDQEDKLNAYHKIWGVMYGYQEREGHE